MAAPRPAGPQVIIASDVIYGNWGDTVAEAGSGVLASKGRAEAQKGNEKKRAKWNRRLKYCRNFLELFSRLFRFLYLEGFCRF